METGMSEKNGEALALGNISDWLYGENTSNEVHLTFA